MLIFKGTKEEFEVVRGLFETKEPSATPGIKEGPPTPNTEMTEAEARNVIRYLGGPSEKQTSILLFLLRQSQPVPSAAVRTELGITGDQFRGIMSNFSRRVSGALGRPAPLLIESSWNDGEGTNYYWLTEPARRAVEVELLEMAS